MTVKLSEIGASRGRTTATWLLEAQVEESVYRIEEVP